MNSEKNSTTANALAKSSDTTSSSSNKPKRWFPLESNPTLLNSYIDKLGFNTDLYEFVDVYATEEWCVCVFVY